MRCVHVCETKESVPEDPFVRLDFFNPVASDSKIAVGIASLPRITGQVDLTSDQLALDMGT
jgi:hypothetical protein